MSRQSLYLSLSLYHRDKFWLETHTQVTVAHRHTGTQASAHLLLFVIHTVLQYFITRKKKSGLSDYANFL